MENNLAEIKIPTLSDLVSENDLSVKENALSVILNQTPPDSWLKAHPTAKAKDKDGNQVSARYLPIERVEYLLTRIFTKWWVEIKDSKVLANSVCVTVRLYVKNPITGDTDWQDGIGATPIQTDSGKGAMDWNFAKSAGVQMAAPSAETYAIKDAAEKFGKIFGKDANRQVQINYDSLLKTDTYNIEDLKELLVLKAQALTKDEFNDCKRIIDNNETASFKKISNLLKSK